MIAREMENTFFLLNTVWLLIASLFAYNCAQKRIKIGQIPLNLKVFPVVLFLAVKGFSFSLFFPEWKLLSINFLMWLTLYYAVKGGSNSEFENKGP